MARGDAYIKVECDFKDCGDDIEMQLTSLADGSWDERDIDKRLARYGWKKEGEKDFCPEHDNG